MEQYNEYHHYLMIARIMGTLTDAEERDFNELTQNDSGFKERFDEVKSNFNSQDIATSFARMKSPDYWDDITPKLKPQSSKVRIFVLRYVAAASLLAVFAFGWLYFNQTVKPAIAVATNQANSVTLQLDNGEVIDLSMNKGTITTSTTLLQNEGNTLQYSGNGAVTASFNKLTIPAGLDYKLVLSDGTKVWLNSATTIAFPFAFNDSLRKIIIDGEAYVEVAKDKRKPFIVQLPSCTVEVLGTEFNVNTYDKNKPSVSLVNGAVQLSAKTSKSILRPGIEGSLNGDKITLETFNALYRLSWREGIYYFHQSTLAEIAPVVKRWYGIEVKVDEKMLASRRFNGQLDKKQPIETFMQDIKTISGIVSYLDKDGILHFK